mmetsp:Transcript_25548/g.51111  ORF Transcript_25548/g.51111 Transcript_25548/m.51111 type:complete len:101 (+) Transcript_25548:300-602(+)
MTHSRSSLPRHPLHNLELRGLPCLSLALPPHPTPPQTTPHNTSPAPSAARCLQEAMGAGEMSESLELHKIQSHEWHIQACCALTGEGLYQGLDWVTSRVH